MPRSLARGVEGLTDDLTLFISLKTPMPPIYGIAVKLVTSSLIDSDLGGLYREQTPVSPFKGQYALIDIVQAILLTEETFLNIVGNRYFF
jgi:hypothetical protein